jgi:hypothetical protein
MLTAARAAFLHCCASSLRRRARAAFSCFLVVFATASPVLLPAAPLSVRKQRNNTVQGLGVALFQCLRLLVPYCAAVLSVGVGTIGTGVRDPRKCQDCPINGDVLINGEQITAQNGSS